MEPTQNTSRAGATAIILGLVVVLLVAGSAYMFVKLPKKDEIIVQETPIVATPETVGTAPTPIPTPVPTSVLVYKDGSYTAMGDYNSAGGAEEIQITLTLKDGVITDAVATPQATLLASINFQTKFTTDFKALVVGKSIDTVTLDKVSGSSLTPKGFNDAVVKIRAQAQTQV